ncbi:hypothetical protein J3L18_27875 [Mucilaginibacter gossypii]|uniref:hypothetical protein n=1 Tax=Mucilaginibacter gossypii TaxID=551996 RepID=UPI000DCE1D98|nr:MULTISPECIES: hypothetical protein [Mucilaginibacter]QTE36891.1 hypothetical protein J3L18_27875 [Mucilaginibacter gossypii]RAV59265.1 hypothetical protein DIU36_07300 [Mucilaginibacter rubeus]
MTANIKTYTAITLLNEVFEFIEMTPNSNDWNLRSLQANPSRFLRFRKIESLLHAFGIANIYPGLLNRIKSRFFYDRKTPIEALLHGDFIKQREIDEYAVVIDYIDNFIKANGIQIESARSIHVHDLAFIYPKLISFKKKLHSILTHNSGWLEAGSKTSVFSIGVTEAISKNLIGKYQDLDCTIELFINPRGLSFTEIELIEKYNFPVRDLSKENSDFV